MGDGGTNHHITFIVAEKAKFTVPLALFTVYVGERLVENVIWGEGLAESVRIPSQPFMLTCPGLIKAYVVLSSLFDYDTEALIAQ